MQPDSHLDAAFAIFQDRLGTADHLNLSADEPFASDAPPGVGGPLRALTLRVQGEPLALLGLTTPAVAVDKAELITYLTRCARARRIPYLVVSNLWNAWLLPILAHPNDMPDSEE